MIKAIAIVAQLTKFIQFNIQSLTHSTLHSLFIQFLFPIKLDSISEGNKILANIQLTRASFYSRKVVQQLENQWSEQIDSLVSKQHPASRRPRSVETTPHILIKGLRKGFYFGNWCHWQACRKFSVLFCFGVRSETASASRYMYEHD